MPSTSPGPATTASTAFSEILPGTPAQSLQATTSCIYRFKRYIAYISGCRLNVLSGPTTLVQAVTFKHELVAVAADAKSGKLLVAGKEQAWILEPVAEGWTQVRWEKALLLRQLDAGDEIQSVCWSNEGEALLGGSRSLTLFSSLPTSRNSSPRPSAVDGEAVEERRPLWSKPVARPVQQTTFSPSSTLIATRSRYDRLVKIWRRLSFEEGLFDHTYLPHPSPVTHVEWRPLDEHSEIRRGSAISRRHDEEQEVLYTIASDGVLRMWRTGGLHDLDMLVLHTSIDLVAAIPDSPSLSAHGDAAAISKSARYAVMLPSNQFSAALSAAIGLSQDDKFSHAKEYMKELVLKELDLVIVLDGQGRMSAWGLQSVGHKRRPGTPTTVQPFHIAHAEGLPLKLPLNAPALPSAWFQDDKIHILVQSLTDSGGVSWWQGLVEAFIFTSAPGADRLSLASSWRHVGLAEWSDLEGRVERPGVPSVSLLGQEDRDQSKHNVVLVRTADERCEVKLLKNGQVDIVSQRLEHIDGTSNHVASFDIGFLDGALLAANAEVAAVFNSGDSTLHIMNTRDGYVEHRQVLDNSIHSAHCLTLNTRQSFVAVANDTDVHVFAQSRYEDSGASMRSWRFVKCISVAQLGLNITGLAWRVDGSIAVEAGAALFISGPVTDVNQLADDIRESADIPEDIATVPLAILAEHFSRPLPVWHPSTLERLVVHGHVGSAVSIARTLTSKLRFWSSGDELSATLDQEPETFLRHPGSQQTWLDVETVNDLKEQLNEKQLPGITRNDQQRLALIVDTLFYLRDHVNGLDNNSLSYLFAWKLQILLHQETVHPEDDPARVARSDQNGRGFVPEMSWCEIAFAHHSTSQQPLLDILVLYYDNKLTWDIARRLGVMSWLTDREALFQVFEQMAQTAYRSSSPPDPVNAAIYYLALHKKQTLAALWRIATWHREQRPTTNFLKKDFSQAESKTAAKKNAYALMGKRRFHYAAAFFLLADDAADACSVLAGQCDDVQFAVAVARLYCGDGSEVLRKLLVDRVLPDAKAEGNRWLSSWCHSVLSEKDKAAQCLLEPLENVVKAWQQDDPALLLLYKHLRIAASEHEYNAVLRSAKIAGRMGLLLLSLQVIKDWKFARPTYATAATTNGLTNGFHALLPERTTTAPTSLRAELIELPSLLDSFTRPGPTRSTSKDDQSAREAKAAELLAKIKARKNASEPRAEEKDEGKEREKRQPTQFKEPDANSLLDSFGF